MDVQDFSRLSGCTADVSVHLPVEELVPVVLCALACNSVDTLGNRSNYVSTKYQELCTCMLVHRLIIWMSRIVKYANLGRMPFIWVSRL